MDEARREKLAGRGLVVMTAREGLGLDDRDEAVIELRIRLSWTIRARREAEGISQAELARRIETTQPRVAKIEGAGSGVSFDQLIEAFLATGAGLPELGALISGPPLSPPTATPKRAGKPRAVAAGKGKVGGS